MKKDIHPEYIPCKVTCACGNSFEIYTNTDTLRIELCDKCHPFYTGNEKTISAGGRVDRFKKKYGLK
jgi:large subunit ribosomal protein L31